MFSLRARLVLPVDQPPIDGGVVTIEGARIVAVGKTAAGGEVRDLGDVALLPGLVNVHTHLEYSLLERPIGQRAIAFPDWIRQVVTRKRAQPAPAGEAVAAGLSESLRHGVTSLGEIASAGWAEEVFAGWEGSATVFEELIGLRTVQAEETLRGMTNDEFRSHTRVRPLPDPLPEYREREQGAGEECSRVKTGLSPHAPYSVHPDLLDGAVALACKKNWPLAMHLAESREEIELLRSGGGSFRDLLKELGVWNPAVFAAPRRPLDYLRALSAAPRSLVIHGNYLDDEEISFAGAHADRMSVVYCPRTHAYFGHDPHPLPKLLAAGALVALGTDGRGSNPDLDLWAELRHVAQQFPAISAETILRLGTLNAAQALGIDGHVGSLTPGKQADLLALPLTGKNSTDSAQLLAADDSSSKRFVMCAGRWVHGPEGSC